MGATIILATFLIASLAQGAITYGRWRDISPTDYSTDVTGTIRGVYVRNGGTGSIGAGDGWAVGGDGATPIISHYDGFSWQIMASPVAGAVYNSVHLCTSPGAPGVGLCSANGDGSDGWMVGGAAGNLAAVYWDGSALTNVSPSPAAAGTFNSVFMVCHSPPYGTGCPSGADFASGKTYAVGTNGAQGVIYVFNGNPKSGGGWTLQFTSASTGAGGFNGVYLYVNQAGGLSGFAVGASGVIATLSGGAWTEVVVAAGVIFNGVFVDRGNPADAWAVGNALSGNAQIYHFSSGFWSGPVSPGATLNDLVGVFLTSNSEGWIVGRAGTILHSTTLGGANAWLALQTPLQTAVGSGIDLLGVSFPSGSNGWAVGKAGAILHTENTGCPGVPSPCWGGSSSITQSPQLNAVYMTGTNDAWAGGSWDAISGIHSLIHWDGNKWHRATVSAGYGVTQPDIWGIYMLSSSEGWAVGGNSANTAPSALKWDGNSWMTQPVAACTCSLRSVFMISGGTGGDGWAVGTGGNIYRYQSGSWLQFMTVPGNPQLNGVFINNPGSNVAYAGWAVGNGGTVVKLTIVGGVPTWSAVGIPGITTQHLYGVYFKDSNHGWIVGGSATIVTTTDGGTTWSGGTGQVTGDPGTAILRSVSVDTYGVGSGNGDGWAVGETVAGNALFAHWDGGSWTATALSPSLGAGGLQLYSVYVRGPEDGFAVGRPITGGTLSGIFHLDPLNPPTGGGGGGGTTTTTTQSTTSSSTSTSVVSSTVSSTSTSEASTSSVVTSSSEVTSSTESSTSSSTSAATVTVTESSSSTTTPLVMPAVPGFPIESIIAGVALGLATLAVMRRRRTRA